MRLLSIALPVWALPVWALPIWALSIRLLLSTSAAFGNECHIHESPIVLFQAAHELHQVWTINDSPIYGSPSVSDDLALSNYQSEIEKRVPDHNQISLLKHEYQDFLQSGDPAYLAETFATQLVFTKQAGHIRPINCLESLLLTIQLKRQPMIEQPSEFGAFILKNTDASYPKLKIYYSTFDRPGGKVSQTVTSLIESDLASGWILWRHLHNHNFLFQNSISIMGGTCPSRPDLQLYLDLIRTYGLKSASVTNGFETADLTPADFIKLTSE
ncbi:MAG: hypothetical protein ACJ763_03920 [Bdellovibrionia bacterium]